MARHANGRVVVGLAILVAVLVAPARVQPSLTFEKYQDDSPASGVGYHRARKNRDQNQQHRQGATPYILSIGIATIPRGSQA